MKTRILFLLVCVALMTNCGSSGSSGSSNQPSAGQLAGNWQFTLQKDAVPATKFEAGFLQQTGNAVTGTLQLTGGGCNSLGTLTGTATGTTVSFTIQQTAENISMSGTTADNGASMSGSYTILAQGCGVSETGTWSAVRVTAPSAFTGTLTSMIDGSTSSVSGTLKQGANTGASTAPLSGSITSSDSPCFGSASITGVIGGASMVWNLLASDGSQIGQFSVTMPTGDSSTSTSTSTPNPNPNAKYSFVPHPDFAPGTPCRFGDRGNAMVATQ